MNASRHTPLRTSVIARATLASLMLAALAGCASIAGVGGTAEFGCKAPIGVKCDSVSGIYANAIQQNLPSQQKGAAEPQASVAARASEPNGKDLSALTYATKATASGTTLLTSAPSVGMPLRAPARVLRLWIKPWEDGDGDLHSASFVYVPVDSGRWLIDHARRAAREAYVPIRPPRTTARSEAPAAAPERDAPLSASTLAARLRGASAPSPASRGDDDGQ